MSSGDFREVDTMRRLFGQNKACQKCGGSGWIWQEEKDDFDGSVMQKTQTRVICDWCGKDKNDGTTSRAFDSANEPDVFNR